MMSLPRIPRSALPLQVAAVCYRRVNSHAEFLLVNTNGGNKWTFPKGAPEPRLSHSQAAEREAKEEAGAIGIIEPRHFHIYVHSKGVFWQPGGVQEYVVKAFLMEVRQTRRPEEDFRNPTWFDAEKARVILAKGREVKYAHELQTVIDRALEHLGERGWLRLASVEQVPARPGGSVGLSQASANFASRGRGGTQ